MSYRETLSSSSSSSSPSCRVFIFIFLRQTVPREYSVAAILLLLFMVLISLVPVLNLLYFYISTFQSMCVVPNMAVLYSSLTSCFPGMLLTYFLNDFEIVPLAPIVTGITFVFTFHMHCISIVRSLYFRIFSAYFLITFLAFSSSSSYYYYHHHHHHHHRRFIVIPLKTKRRLLSVKTQSIPCSKHFSSCLYKTDQFMVCGTKFAICFEITTKYINTVWQNLKFLIVEPVGASHNSRLEEVYRPFRHCIVRNADTYKYC